MSDKLEALSQPVGLVTNQLDGAVIVESDQLLPGDNVYSHEYVTALLAALEEANKQLSGEESVSDMTRDSAKYWKQRAEAAEKEVKQWHDVAMAAAQDDADWHKLTDRKNDLICKLVDAGIAQITRANAAEQREEHLKATVDVLSAKNAELEQRLQQPMPKGFSHQDGAPHALLGTGDVMISHIKWADAQGIAFAPMPAGKAGIGVNVDADVAGKSSDEIGAVFVVKATSVQSLEVLKEAVQMAIDGFKAEVEGE